MKEATHIGKISTSHGEGEARIYETPKFWTDGHRKWRKLDRHGVPDQTPVYSRRDGWTYTRLHVDTIRPLTVAEIREPMATRVANNAAYVERLREERTSLSIKHDAAVDELHQSEVELDRFDKKSPTPEPDQGGEG